jgi:hypothetical protein
VVTYILIALGATYALWVFYIAVMGLKRVRDTVGLSPWALRFGYPVLIVGYVLDVLVNWFVFTVVMLEIPKELTVSSRLKRHNQESTGWRLAVVKFFEPLLDPFDPSGNHV